jgi:flagellin-like hook-associated protein FlgL
MEQTLASTHSEMKEDRLANELISLASANSTIIDTDMAKEQSENIRQFILQKTATASMAKLISNLGNYSNRLDDTL